MDRQANDILTDGCSCFLNMVGLLSVTQISDFCLENRFNLSCFIRKGPSIVLTLSEIYQEFRTDRRMIINLPMGAAVFLTSSDFCPGKHSLKRPRVLVKYSGDALNVLESANSSSF